MRRAIVGDVLAAAQVLQGVTEGARAVRMNAVAGQGACGRQVA